MPVGPLSRYDWHLRDSRRPPSGPYQPARQEAYQATLLAKAERIGLRSREWAQAVIEERGVRAYRLLQGMVSLTRRHPRERVDWVYGVALERRLFRYAILQRLVEQAADRTPAQQLPLLQEHPLIRELLG